MVNPESFFLNSIHWNNWVTTKPGRRSYEMEVGCASYVSFHAKSKLNKQHPGFTSAYDTLAYLGCDPYFVTDMLKFCLSHADGEALDTFLRSSKRLEMIEMALAIGMSVNELIPLLTTAVSVERAHERTFQRHCFYRLVLVPVAPG